MDLSWPGVAVPAPGSGRPSPRPRTPPASLGTHRHGLSRAVEPPRAGRRRPTGPRAWSRDGPSPDASTAATAPTSSRDPVGLSGSAVMRSRGSARRSGRTPHGSFDEVRRVDLQVSGHDGHGRSARLGGSRWRRRDQVASACQAAGTGVVDPDGGHLDPVVATRRVGQHHVERHPVVATPDVSSGPGPASPPPAAEVAARAPDDRRCRTRARATPGTTAAARTLVNSDPGPITTWSARAMASTAAGGGAGRRARRDRRRRPGGLHLHLALDPAPTRSRSPVRVTGTAAAGSTRPTAPTSRADLVERGHEVVAGSTRPAISRLPRAWPFRSPASKRCSRARAEHRVRRRPARSGSGGGRPGGTIPRSARSRPLDPPSSATDTTAVMSPAYGTRRPQGRRQPVPAADARDRASGPRRRAASLGDVPVRSPSARAPQVAEPLGDLLGDRDRAVATAGAAERDGQVRLALGLVLGQEQGRAGRSTRSRNGVGRGWART